MVDRLLVLHPFGLNLPASDLNTRVHAGSLNGRRGRRSRLRRGTWRRRRDICRNLYAIRVAFLRDKPLSDPGGRAIDTANFQPSAIGALPGNLELFPSQGRFDHWIVCARP